MSVPRFARFAKFFSGSAAPASKQRSPTVRYFSSRRFLGRETSPVQVPKTSLRYHLEPILDKVATGFLFCVMFTSGSDAVDWILDNTILREIDEKEAERSAE